MFVKVFVNHQSLPISRTHSSYWVVFLQRWPTLPRGCLHGGNPPVDPGVIARRIEERQGHQGDGRSNGQGADEAHEEANEA